MNWMGIEYIILDWLQGMHSPMGDALMKGVSTLGNAGFLWILLGAVFLFFKKTRSWGILVLLALLIDFISCNVFLKNLIARDRPCWIYPEVPMLVAVPEDYSFPSGHTMAAFAASAALFFKDKIWGTAALVLAAVMGISRLYLFVHWPTDVLAGMILGVGCAFLAREILTKWERRQYS